jgi:hypothetical protein
MTSTTTIPPSPAAWQRAGCLLFALFQARTTDRGGTRQWIYSRPWVPVVLPPR